MSTEKNNSVNVSVDTNRQEINVLSGICKSFHRSFKYDENIATSLSSPVKTGGKKKIIPGALHKNKQRSSSIDEPFFFH